ncbi:LOW QUALITY PROTEIN: uncharacterized protein LOC107461290 [Arachis duranensis]|uniref:ATP-dependent DNA helicase n=1 Tax=Arachis duranensis TaxID=130453 RepID=A0A6P5MKI6_ARADU|nr:LOW QUALITY PROTEIN: uncharacterized protein LOC107461290 [Arachis duranensis]
MATEEINEEDEYCNDPGEKDEPLQERHNPEYWHMGQATYECQHCNALFWYEERIGKHTNSTNPKYTLCCRGGQVKLPPFKEHPLFLNELFFGRNTPSKHFREKVRLYNSMFAFTSMGGRVQKGTRKSKGPPTFILGGQNYHLMGSLLPPEGSPAKFSTTSNTIHASIVQSLKETLDNTNVLVKSFRMVRDSLHNGQQTNIKLKLIGKRRKDGRRYNLPTVSEVAALIVGDFDSSRLERDIVVESRSGALKRITELHPAYLPLQYPLLFPYGDDGFRENIVKNTPNKKDDQDDKYVTMREWFAYRIQDRFADASPLLYSGRLFQQFIVDAYTMIETCRLNYIRTKKKELRCDMYKGIREAVLNGETEPASRGKRIVLPASFTGGARYMIQNYQDAMAICRVVGYPDLFITLTCNPKWQEIQDHVCNRGLKAEDRPDIVCRVFKAKLDHMLRDIRVNKLFGRVRALVYTIEFQKRGLPHAHILLFLHQQDKYPTGIDIDQIISAEIPDQTADPEYYEAVKTLMMHGPCGIIRKDSPCMEDGRCIRNFPKRYVESTTLDDEGYPVYRRRDDGRFININGVDLDNRYVVPHNRLLLMRYGAHINVEWCNQSRSIKYLFKYVNKGNDRVTASFYQSSSQDINQDTIDEISMYYDCRYISPCEAAWRIIGYDIHYRDPSIVRLSFHLPEEQTVVFDDNVTLDKVQEKATVKESMFLAWFEANKKVLLNLVKGPTCYTDIRFHNGVTHGSFRDACYARGLLDDDKEYIDAIKEASQWGAAPYLRNLFATLLFSKSIERPEYVWEETKMLLSEDILHHQRKLLNHPGLQLTTSQVETLTLIEIEKILNINNRSLKDWDTMPFPSDNMSSWDPYSNSLNRLIVDELGYDRSSLHIEHNTLIKQMTSEQLSVYEKIMNSVESCSGGVYFLYGYGGTGKTFVWNTLASALRSKGDIVLTVASSGIASLLLPGGRIAHSRFGIPLNLDEYSTCNIKQGSQLAELITRCKLIIWDEAPMVHKFCFEALDRTMRDIMRFSNRNSESMPFGGKTIVFGGDFRQILPVIPKGSRQDIVNATINASYIWDHCQVLKLTKNMRLQAAHTSVDRAGLGDFAEWILKVGDGAIGNKTDGSCTIKIPGDILIRDWHDPIKAITFLSSDTVSKSEFQNDFIASIHTPEFINTIKCSGVPNHVLKLKVGIPIMLLRNIDHSAGLCNGTRMVITKLGKRVIKAKVLSGTSMGQEFFIPRMTLTPSDHRIPFKFQRRQFPIMVSYGMTINKSQGQSLSRVGLLLKKPVFCHGQLYVAISRVTSRSGLKIVVAHDHKEDECVDDTHIVVYKEVFRNVS